jgi:hypothetical protein
MDRLEWYIRESRNQDGANLNSNSNLKKKTMLGHDNLTDFILYICRKVTILTLG